MQKFNNINLESRFIKNILQNTYIPTLPIVTDGDFIVSGVEYCFKNHLIRCITTGRVTSSAAVVEGVVYVPRHPEKNPLIVSPSASDSIVCAPDFICGVGVRKATYTIIEKISSDKNLSGLNYAYKSHTDKYDSETHKHLGNYLRWYRDSYGVDLLPFYNCFCGETYTLTQIKDNHLTDEYDSSKTVHIVPIHLNKRYTVFINSQHTVSMCGTFLNNNGRVLNPLKDDRKYMDEFLDNTVLQYESLSFHTPITYEMNTADPQLMSYNNNFYLIIQMNSSNFCPIVVLEGDYKANHSRLVTSTERYNDNANVNIDYSLFKPPVNPSLTLAPTSFYTPYSPRLIEYLTENVITNIDDIPKNILRIQDSLNMGYDGDLNDVWSDEMRFLVYNKYFRYTSEHYFNGFQLDDNYRPTTESMNTKTIPEDLKVIDENGEWVGTKNCKLRRTFETSYDITGYVDKDVENSLFRYRSV